MKQLIHETITNIKFLYPCIAYEESCSETELIVITETKLSKIYPVNLSVPGMKSLGDDFWGRPTFIDEQGKYYCELDGQLYFKGHSSDGEPIYPVKQKITYSFPSVDSELSEFKRCIEKVNKYAQLSDNLFLLEGIATISQDPHNVLDSVIICRYRFEVQT